MTQASLTTLGEAQVTSEGGVFSKSVLLPASPEAVFALCTGRKGFEAHFPHPVKDYEGPESFSPGCSFTFKYRMNGLWLSWGGKVVDWVENQRFTDEMTVGLFRRFVHTHIFEPAEGGKTLYTDRIEFAFGVPLKVNQWVSGKMLGTLFRRRHELLLKIFESGAASNLGGKPHA